MSNLFNIIFSISFNYKLNLVGDFYYSQMIIIFTAIYFFFKKKFFINSLFEKKLYFIGFLWLLNQLISDLVNQTSFNDLMRGNAKIIIILLSFYVFFRITNVNYIKIINLLITYIIVSILFDLINTVNFFDSWKFGFGTFITILLILVNTTFKKNINFNKSILFSIFLIGIYSIFLGTRYLFVFNTLFVILIIFTQYFKFRLSKLLMFLIIFLMPINYFYSQIIQSDLLQSRYSEKYTKQSSGLLGPLIGGRSEIIASTKAIYDSPILGHGSWSSNCEYTIFLHDKKISLNYTSKLNLDNCLIPSHSVIFGTWVQSGIFGFIFWIFILINIFITLNKIIFKDDLAHNKFKYLLIYLSIACIWDIIFSPLGGTRTIVLPLYIIILLNNSQKIKKNVLIK